MTAIFALWGLVPTKDKLYGAAIVTLLVLFVLYTFHERSVGAQRVADVQKRAAETQAAQATAKTQTGIIKSSSAQVKYVSTINAVIPDSPHLLVLDSGAATAAVCAASYPTERDEPTESTVEHPRDVGPALDKIGRDSDAQVTYLQDILRSCINIGACKLQQ